MLRIFLSHVRDDGVTVRRLAEALKRAGHQPLLVEDAARVGESVLEVLERCLGEADVAVLCLSRAALSDAWMQTEFQTVLARLEGRGHPVLAVRFERVAPPGGMAHCLSVDLFLQEAGWNEGTSALLEVLGRFDKERARDGLALRLGNLPPAPAVFVDRKETLRQLEEALAPVSDGEGNRRATLVGEEGIGRTSTALRFAYEVADQFPAGVWWCEAQGRTADESLARLVPELRRLAPLGIRSVLDTVGALSPTSEVAQAARQALSQLQPPSLLVIDDAEQLDWSSHLPAGRVSVLMTRRSREGAIGEVIELGPLSPDSALELVDALSTLPQAPMEREARSRVARELLAGRPLELSLIARLQQESEAPWTLLEQALKGHLEETLSGAEPEQVRIVLDEAIDRCTPAMRRLLESMASFEAGIPVPIEWVIAASEMHVEELNYDQALQALVVTDLIDWEEERDTLSMHALVRQRVRERMEPTRREHLLRRAMNVMVAWLKPRITQLRSEKLAEVEKYQPQFQQSLQVTEHWPPFMTWVVLAMQTASILEVRQDLPSALELWQLALARAEPLAASREQLICLAKSAAILHRMGQVERASPYLQRASQFVDALPVRGDYDLAASMHVLASIVRVQDSSLARRLAERALQEAERLATPDEALTGAVLGNLALSLTEAGDASAALPLVQRAVELTQLGAGQDSTFFADRLSEQAQVMMALNDWLRARSLLEQALSIDERLLPVDHPMIGEKLSLLGGVLLSMGESAAARPLLERAAGIVKAKLGPEHPFMATLLHNLGIALLQAGQEQQAAAVLARALTLLEKTRAWDKQLLSSTRIGLAMALRAVGDTRASVLHLERALDTGWVLYAPEDGPGYEALEKALRLARGRQVNPEAYVSALTDALALAEREGDADNAARAALLLGAFEGRRGAWEAARSHVERGLRLAKQAEAPLLVAESHRLLGDASLHGSRYEDARLHYAEAIRRLEEMKHPSRAARVRMLLLVMLLQLGRTESVDEHAAALEAALKEGAFTDPMERAEVEQVLRLVDAARRGASPGPQGKTMNIINGSIDRRRMLLAGSHLTEIPFSRTDPPDAVIDRVFVGRAQQLRDAAFRTVDRPRNILVLGGYGLGKTTFIRKLLRELHGSKTMRFLTGYAPLQSDSSQGFQLAALGAFVDGALSKAPPGTPLHGFALKTREELARLDPSGAEALQAPYLRFQEGLELARNEGIQRVVIAVDEIDKRDAKTVQSILMGSRFFLDMEASFLLTGLFLDAFSDIRASLLAAFDHRVELRPFSAEECTEIIQRNLATARPGGSSLPPTSLEPFEAPVIDEINRRARGLPRPLNLMAESALEEALREALEQRAPRFTVTLKHLDGALRNEGNLVFNDVGAEARQMLARIFQRNGYIGGAELDALSSGGLPETLRSLEELSRKDAVLPVGRTDGTAFALSPAVEQTLTELEQLHERLQALWREVLAATDKNTSGRALEEFANTFFGQAFRVTSRNARTDTEELDLLLERTDRTDPRFNDTYFMVECKNWKSQPVGQKVISELLGKMITHRRIQAFLLASGEVTSDAKTQAIHARSSAGVEIIVLDGRDIEGFLGSMKTVGDFLNEKHKSQTMLRTF